MIKIIANKQNEEYLAAGLSLVRPDLEGYVISAEDLKPSSPSSKKPERGIEIFEQGQAIKKLAQMGIS